MEPFLGQISLFAFNKIPAGWKLCDGTIMQVSGNQALFSLLGTHFGGNGTTTFALPDLRGRVIMSQGLMGTYGVIGDASGSETVTLTQATCPAHTHYFQVNNAFATQAGAKDALYAGGPDASTHVYAPVSSPMVAMDSTMLAVVGGGAAHENMQPFQVLVYCIAISGTYPQRP